MVVFGVIRFDSVSVVYPNGTRALDRATLELPGGRLTALLGASGSGKTTLLKLCNRLIEPTEGRVVFPDALDPIALRLRTGYVIQEGGLIPHMTVEQNIGLVPRLLGWDEGRRRDATAKAAETARLPGELLGRYPSQLSGGQRQRAAFARALAGDPPTLLMDEPFASLDPASRKELQKELKQIAGGLQKTIVFVTHDHDEAAFLADSIVVLEQGRVASGTSS
jgi:osmoprotectant transport system ATP-binding protein